MNSKRSAITSLISILVLGFVLGYFTISLLNKNKRKGPPSSESMIAYFTSEFTLDESQQQVLTTLLCELKDRHNQLRTKRMQDYKHSREQFRTDFMAVLADSQQIKYAEFSKKFDERHSRDRSEKRKKLSPNFHE